LILRGATQTECLGIRHKTEIPADAFNIGGIGPLREYQAVQSDEVERLRKDCVRVFGIEFLLTAVVAEALRDCAAQTQVGSYRISPECIDLLAKLLAQTIKIIGETSAQLFNLRNPKVSPVDLSLCNFSVGHGHPGCQQRL
jgi:hypothetical protein